MPVIDRQYATLPGLPGLFWRMLTLRRKGLAPGESIDLMQASMPSIETDQDLVARWCDMTGYRLEEGLAMPWPFIPAQRLTMALIADPAWPLRAMGMVHIRQTISQYQAVLMNRPYQAKVRVEGHETARQGRLFNFITDIIQDDRHCQTVESRYLVRGGGNPDLPREAPINRPATPTGPDRYLPANMGRDYARISGDFNPIHLYAWTAKPLGFSRQILHGMAAAAWLAKKMEDKAGWSSFLPSRLDIAFKTPMLLPSTIIADIHEIEDQVCGTIWPQQGDAPHIIAWLDKLDGPLP